MTDSITIIAMISGASLTLAAISFQFCLLALSILSKLRKKLEEEEK